MPRKTQICSTDHCDNTAAFTTRSKPAWCTDCLTRILNTMSLEPVVPFPGKAERWRTCCRDCGAECDYLLEYLLDLQTRNEPACRFCFWTQWAESANRMSGLPVRSYSIKDQQTMFARIRHEPVRPLVPLPSHNHPILVRCKRCGRQEARRPGDMSCTCTSNPAPRSTGSGPRRTQPKNLFVDSGHPTLKFWDHAANSETDFKTVTIKAHKLANWACPDCGHKFSARVFEMTDPYRPNCPACEEVQTKKWREEYERLKQTPVSAVPELLAAWADDDGDPSQVMVADQSPIRFKCPKGHHPRVSPRVFLESGCPSCRGLATAAREKPMLADVHPEIASQWHPDRNGRWTAANVGPDSTRAVWWRADCCGYEWQAIVASRNKHERQRCPQCETILDSLAWSDPGLAAEWSAENPISAWYVRPHAQTAFMPKWVCSVDASHLWEAAVGSRSGGSECPECRETGKSRVELDHLEAAKKVLTIVRSGAIVRDTRFRARKSWTVDILAEHDGAKVAIEYDGAYWHGPEAKQLVDRSKSLDLLTAGYLVVRLREDELPALDITNANYREIRVHSTAPRPAMIIAEVAAWLESLKGRQVVT